MSRGTDASERRRCSPVLNRKLEVDEHASVLRALRTEHTRDLTAQLIRYLRHEETTTMTASPPQPEHGRQNRDQWTRWPLPDAPQLEWDLDDEIGVIVRGKLLGVSRNHLDDAEENYIDELVQHLTPILTQFLERILVIVEEHTVLRPPSLQDRVNPLTWCDLANILASPAVKDLVDGQLLGQYVDRMESILGESQASARQAVKRHDMFDLQRAERQVLYGRLLAALF